MDFTGFKEQIKQNFCLDLDSYKEKQLKRRIDNLMEREKKKDYVEYMGLLLASKETYEKFLDTLTINVTEFFRDKEAFTFFERNILPILIKNKYLKIWSAACANGAEPYSVAILLKELTPGCVYQIEATDIDANVLKMAMTGKYNVECLRNVSPHRLARFFYQDGEHYVIKEQVKQKVFFKKHDLLRDFFGQNYNLIICRNVVIYFTPQAQSQLYVKFYHSLAPEGILFTGGSEIILNYAEKGFERIAPCFYKKVSPPTLTLPPKGGGEKGT